MNNIKSETMKFYSSTTTYAVEIDDETFGRSTVFVSKTNSNQPTEYKIQHAHRSSYYVIQDLDGEQHYKKMGWWTEETLGEDRKRFLNHLIELFDRTIM